MNTHILKWDVRLQALLLLLTFATLSAVAYEAITYDWTYAGWGLLTVLYIEAVFTPLQFTGNAMHLALQHKSVGYSTGRRFYLFTYPVYIGLLLCFHTWMVRNINEAVLGILLLGIPVTVSCIYFLFCRSELKFLQKREFFILH
jgi:hypothetical protein